MSYGAVAEIAGIPVGTVRSRLSRGRTALRRLMDIDIIPDNQTTAAVPQVDATTGFNDPGLLAA
jgi:RNA polymerase sigma-70 factor (ECF subfamily)